SSSEAPHRTHFPPSRFHTASLTAVGMIRRRSGLTLGGTLKSSSPSTASRRNLNTERCLSRKDRLDGRNQIQLRPQPMNVAMRPCLKSLSHCSIRRLQADEEKFCIGR